MVFRVQNSVFLDSSMVEHSAVNRGVVGSSPTRGVYHLIITGLICAYSVIGPAGRLAESEQAAALDVQSCRRAFLVLAPWSSG